MKIFKSVLALFVFMALVGCSGSSGCTEPDPRGGLPLFTK